MKRNIIIVFLVAIVIICISALLILFAKGYQFSGRKVIQTALINIESDPKGAEIYVNGSLIGNSPKQIDGLDEGEYDIILKKEGYTEWQKKVTVVKGVVTNLYPTLFPLDLKLNKITDTNIDKAFFSVNGEVVAYVVSSQKEENQNGIWLLKLTKSLFSLSDAAPTKISPVSIIPESVLIEKSYNMKIAADNKSVLISYDEKTDTTTTKKFKIINSNISPNDPLNINTDLKFNPESVEWETTSDNIFIFEPQLIIDYSLKTKESKVVKYFKQTSYEVFENNETLIILENSESIQNIFIYYRNTLKQIDSLKISALSSVENVISTDSATPILLISTANALYWYNSKDDTIKNILTTKANLISASPDNLSFLFSEENVLKSLVFMQTSTTPEDIVYTIQNSYFSDKFNVKWHPASTHLVVFDTENKELFFIENDGNNKTKITDAAIPSVDSYSVTADGNSVVLLIQETSTVDGKEITEANLYKIDLKASNPLSLF